MRKFSSTIFALAVLCSAFAQQIAVKSVDLVDKEVLTDGFYPRFSKDGNLLLFSSENYKGIKAYDFSTRVVKELTSDNGAGYGYFQGSGLNTVFYKKTEMVDNRKNSTLFSYDLATDKQSQLTNSVQGQSPLKSADVKIKSLIGSTVYIENQKIIYDNGATKTVLAPNGQAYSYFWPVLSPDGTKIAYAVAGKGTFVCDLKGKNSVALGNLHAPQWINNKWLVGMNDKDDGYVVTSSEIVAVTVDGKTSQYLTNTSDVIEMYPSASPSGDKIAFNTSGGKLYIMNISVE